MTKISHRKLLKKHNITNLQNCTATQGAQYLQAVAENRPHFDHILYDDSGLFDAHRVSMKVPIPGSNAFKTKKVAPSVPHARFQKEFAKAMSALKDIGIKISRLESQQRFIADAKRGKYPGKVLIVVVRDANFDTFNKHFAGYFTNSFTDVSKKNKIYVSPLLFNARILSKARQYNINNPSVAILHEIGHLLGLEHMPQQFSRSMPDCSRIDRRHRTKGQKKAIRRLMADMKCAVQVDNCKGGSIMFCDQSVVACSQRTLSDIDKVAFTVAYEKMTGKKIPSVNITKAHSADRKRSFIIKKSIPETDTKGPQHNLINQATVAFFAAFAIAVADALAKKNISTNMSDLGKSLVKSSLIFMITAAFYSLPIACIALVADTVLQQINARYPSHSNRISYLGPCMPALFNTLYSGLYLRSPAMGIVDQVGNVALELGINTAASMGGSWTANTAIRHTPAFFSSNKTTDVGSQIRRKINRKKQQQSRQHPNAIHR